MRGSQYLRDEAAEAERSQRRFNERYPVRDNGIEKET